MSLTPASNASFKLVVEYFRLGDVEVKFTSETNVTEKLVQELQKTVLTNAIDYVEAYFKKDTTPVSHDLDVHIGSSCLVGFHESSPSKFKMYSSKTQSEEKGVKWTLKPQPPGLGIFYIHSEGAPYHWKYDKSQKCIILERDNDGYQADAANFFVIDPYQHYITPYLADGYKVFGHSESQSMRQITNLPVGKYKLRKEALKISLQSSSADK